MFQLPHLSYHNVDSYVETEGFFYCETMSRLDQKKKKWEGEEGLEIMSEDLLILKSEYVDLENLEIFIALIEYLEDKIKDSEQGTKYYALKEEGLDKTTIDNYIKQMINNIEEGLMACDYRMIDQTSIYKLEDFVKLIQENKYLKYEMKSIIELTKNRVKKKIK